MGPKAPRKRLSSQTLVETGMAEEREKNLLRVAADDWTVLFEWPGPGKAAASVERSDGFTLVHLDLPEGTLGEYHISVQQPFLDIHRSWVGKFHVWQGLELTSVAMNFNFTTAANHSLPVVCNYSRSGENRGVVGLLDQVPLTKINQRLVIEEPPMHLLQTQFTRARRTGGFRETVVLYREAPHFAEAVRRFMRFCRRRQGIEPLPAPEWARDPVWCSWYSHLYLLVQRDVEAQIPHLKKLGIRTVLIDASWFQSKNTDTGCQLESGDYCVNKNFFPDLPGLSRRLHDEGLKLMLWCAPLFVGVRARSRKAMAPYCTWDGKIRTSVLCPFCEESKAHGRGVMERLMSDYQLDGMKLDFMDADFKDTIEPPCVDPAHDHGDGNYGAAMIEFMRALRDGILKVNPDAAIEYRISYSTLATLPFANCHRGNDAPYDADYMRRENLFLRLFCEYPSAIWNDYAYWHAGEKIENVSLMLGGQIFSGGVPTLGTDLTHLSDQERRVIGRWMRFYRRHRDTLARAALTVHSADSILSVSSLRSAEKGEAFVLLAGQHIPAQIALAPDVRQAWVFNASAEKRGGLTLTNGASSSRVRIAGLGPVRLAL